MYQLSQQELATIQEEITQRSGGSPLSHNTFISVTGIRVYPYIGNRLVFIDPEDENFVIKYQIEQDSDRRDNELEYKICRELFQRRLAPRFDIAYAYQLSEDYHYLKMERALGLRDRDQVTYPDWLVDKKPHNLGLIDNRVVVVDYGNIVVADYLELTFRLD